MRKVISLLMALLMVLSLLPTAWAANVDDTSFTAEEAVQQEEAEEAESVPTEEVTEAPEDTTADPVEDPEPAADQPAVLAAGSSVDEQLKAAGFVAPELGTYRGDRGDCYPYAPWPEDNSCVSFDDDGEGHLTITVKKGTQAGWQRIFDAVGYDFPDGLYVDMRSDFPSGGTWVAAMLLPGTDSDPAVDDFARDDIDDYMRNASRRLGRRILLVDASVQNGKAVLTAQEGETSFRYLMVWDNDNNSSNGRLAKYNLVITVKVEEDFSYECTAASPDTALANAGFTAPPEMGSYNGSHKDFYAVTPWPDNGCISFDYDSSGSTGHLTVTLKKGTLADWQNIYTAERNAGFGSSNTLDVDISFDAPSGAVRGAGVLLDSANGTDPDLGIFLNDDIDVFMNKFGDGGYRIFGRYVSLAQITQQNGKAILSAQKGETDLRYLLVWDNDTDSSNGRLAKYNMVITIKVEEDFSYELSTDSLDEQLKAAGFTAPIMGSYSGNHGDFYPVTPWRGTGCVSFSYDGSGDTGYLTVTVKKGTQSVWQNMYDTELNSGFGFSDSLDFDILSDAPANAVQGAGALIWGTGSHNVVTNFLNDDIADYMAGYNNGQYGCFGRCVPLVSTTVQNDKVTLSAQKGETSFRYLLVWDNDTDNSNGRLAKYNLVITVKVEEDFSYELVQKSVSERLQDAGYAAPTASRFQSLMPEGLVQGEDYTYSYNAKTGHLSIQILKGNEAHWQQAFETCYREFGVDVSDCFGLTTSFIKPKTTATQCLFYNTANDDDTVNWFIQNDFTYATWYSDSNLQPGSTWPVVDSSVADNGDASINAEAGTYWRRYIVVWANSSGSVLQRYTLTVSVEIPESFSYEWNTKTLDDKLADAGFIAPEADDANTEMPGSFSVGMPAGLVEGTDYKCTYDSATGELVITLLKGKMADWKSAYLDSIISGDGDRVFFSVYLRSTDGAVSCAQWCGKENYEQLLESDSWDDVFDFSFDSATCGQGLPIADTQENSSGKTAISVSAGTERYYYGVIWTDSAGQTTKYLLKVTIQSSSSFTHTVTSPEIRKLDTSIAGGRFALTTYNPNGISTTWTFPVWENGNIALIPRSGLTLADIANNESWIGCFSAAAPAKGYTLQSCYIDYFAMGNELVRGFDTDENGAPMLDISVFDITTGGSARYVLRWDSSSTSQADIVELLDVRVDGQPRGKLSSSGGDVNIQDVQAIYEYLTQDTVPYAGETACDVNMDGNMDVYDLQRLYECVALGKTL